MEKIAQVSNVLAEMGVARYLKMAIPMVEYFKPDSSESGNDIDSWSLECSFLGKKISYLLQIHDWDFLTLPKVFLKLPLDSTFAKLLRAAHFGPVPCVHNQVHYLDVCYSLTDSRELPRSSPKDVIKWVIRQTNTIIKQTLFDQNYQNKEILREIEPLWLSLSMANFGLSTSLQRYQSCVNLYMDSIPDKKYGVKLRGWTIPYLENAKVIDCATYSLKTNSDKFGAVFQLFEWIQQHRKSLTAIQFLLFLKSVDKKLVGELRFYLEFFWTDLVDKKIISLVLVVQGKYFLPFSLAADEIPSSCTDPKKILSEVDGKAPPNLMVKLQVHPQRAHNLTANYIFNRNTEDFMSKNLMGLNIALIGCGAIGGHLALGMARLGAGADGGELALIDPDLLGTQNLGRHVLGKKYIEKNKAKSLSEEINQQFDNLTITYWEQSALTYGDDFYSKYQVIIDATGKVELSEAMNERYQKGEMPLATFMHVWIRGNGEAVQAVLVKRGDGFACRSCMQESGFYFVEEHDALPQFTTKTGLTACQSFTPYSVAASMSSAALAIDMLLGWINDQELPRYQTRYTEAWGGRRLASYNARRRHDCSVCASAYLDGIE